MLQGMHLDLKGDDWPGMKPLGEQHGWEGVQVLLPSWKYNTSCSNVGRDLEDIPHQILTFS